MKTIAVIQGAAITYDDVRGRFRADADIDADGANGQNGKIAAYLANNKGSEDLANGGMGIRGGRVVGVASWYKDIVVLGDDGQPKVFPGGVIVSKTAYKFPSPAGISRAEWFQRPEAYVDSETVPYIVVPPAIINSVGPV